MHTEPEEFVWRFRIDEKPATVLYDDPLTELIRVQWEQLLRLCIPTHGGKPVQVDGFALMRDPGRVFLIFEDESASRRGGGDGG